MKTAVFGGSFDPVHLGHLFIAEEIKLDLEYERILFVPAYQPPHKNNGPHASSHHRLEMLRVAIGQRRDFVVDPWEITRGGVSYTIDTVRYVLENFTISGRLGLIIGDDNAKDFNSWRESRLLLDTVDIIVAGRTGEDYDAVLGSGYRSIDNTRLPVSSSDIRSRIGAGRAYRYLVPEAVYDYIRHHHLYQDAYADSDG